MVAPVLASASTVQQAALDVARRLAAPPRPTGLRAQDLAPIHGSCAVAAVDGGSALALEGSGVAVGVTRAAALARRAHRPLHELAAPLEVRVLDEALAQEISAGLPGLPPPRRAGELVERWRALREWQLACDMAERLQEGDVLCLDGPIAQHDWPAAVLDALLTRCRERGVLVAGFCKSTSTALDGIPVLLAAARSAAGMPEPWWAQIPRSAERPTAYAARFLRGAPVFQIELPRDVDPADALGKLAPWTRDAGYPGYPYPLALVHNRCALDDALLEDVAHALRGETLRRGVPPDAWEAVFGDFHEVLDRGV